MKYAVKGSLWVGEDADSFRELVLWELNIADHSHNWMQDGTDAFWTREKSRRCVHRIKDHALDSLETARKDRPEYHWKIVRVK